MSRTLSGLQAALLGLAVLLGLGLVGVAIFAVGSRQWFWNDSVHVRAEFPSARGVEAGTRVRIQGIDAGEVVALEPPPAAGGNVMLRLKIHDKFRHLVRRDATVQIVSVGMLGGKVIEIHPGTGKAPPAEDGALLASRPSTELTDVLEQVQSTLEGVVQGEGTLGMLAKDPRAYESLLGLLAQTRSTMVAFQRDAEAVKRVPLLGGLVEDPVALLVRPSHERNRKWFREEELFEAGRAVLTAQGRERLNGLGGWVEGLKHSGSDVVVVSYADPGSPDPARAREITAEQSRVVAEYLKDRHDAHKISLVSWRDVTPLGMGVNPPPAKEREPLPAPRVEILVFVPQN